MYKKLILSLIAATTLCNAASIESEKFQILANNLNSKDDVIIAKGNVVIFSPTYYILAQKAIYDRNSGTFELFDEVVVLHKNTVQTQSNYAFLDINNEKMLQNPAFLLDNNTNVWINSKDATRQADVFALSQSVLSSCDCVDPAWSVRFSSGEFDKTDKWIDAYNARLYFKDVPVFYTPYLGFSTDRSRRTGLLPATIGYGSKEGFMYKQPIFVAPAKNYDIEFNPEIRTNRGYGMYTYFRWADSADSILKVGLGGFKEQDDYVKEQNLINDQHYGWNIDYRRNRLFASGDNQDGLLVDLNWLNDVEYRNLEDVDSSTEKKIESKINYFFATPEYYFGTYFRYYLDKSLDSNDTVLQELPQAQLHKFSAPILFDNLLYSADYKFTNYERQLGVNAYRHELLLPFSYGFSLFDDYLNITLKQELTLIKQQYAHTDVNYDDASFAETRSIVNISTDLLKEYDSVIHTMNLSTNFSIPKVTGKDGDIYSINTQDSNLESFPITKSAKTLTFALNQSLYDNETLKQIINHKISQAVLFDSLNNSELGNLENEVTVNYLLGSLNNRLLYSHQDNELIENSSSVSLTYLDYYLRLGYYMSKDTPNSGKEDLESYTIDTGFGFWRDYKLSYYENYNIEEQTRSKQGIKFNITDKCWDLSLRFEKEIEPASSTRDTSKEQDIIYLELVLKPLGGLQQSYKVNDSSK
jgi:LPS-assembly protein